MATDHRYGILVSATVTTFEPRTQAECDEAAEAVYDALSKLGFAGIVRVEAQRMRRED